MKTPRLILRYLTARDYSLWVEAYSTMRPPQNEWDESNWDDKYLTKAEFQKILKNQKNHRDFDKGYVLGIFRKEDGALLGYVSFNDICRGLFQNAFIGYRIYNIHWGQGYAQEAVHAAVQFGFRQLKLHRIEAGIAPKNRASIAVAKKAGLKKEGKSPRRLFHQDQWIDLLVYAATAEDFGLKYQFPKKKIKSM